MTDMPNATTPGSVRDELRNAYKQASDFEGSLYSALFAALTMLEKQEARIAALEAARPTATPTVLYEGKPVLSLAKDNIQLAIEAIEDIRRQYLEVLRRDRCRTIQPGTNIINRLADAQQYLEKLVEENEEQP